MIETQMQQIFKNNAISNPKSAISIMSHFYRPQMTCVTLLEQMNRNLEINYSTLEVNVDTGQASIGGGLI